MNEIIILLGILIVDFGYILFLIFIYIIQNKKEIIMNHELMHGYISNRFGFREWKIYLKDKNNLCVTTFPKEILIPRNIPRIFLWNLTNAIFDLSLHCLCMDFINIVIYLRNFFSINKKIIINVAKYKKS